jgi:hypothetical protein
VQFLKLDELIREEQHVTVTGMTAEVGIWHFVVWEVVKIEGYWKVCACWVLHLLMEKYKCQQKKCFLLVAGGIQC